MSVNVVNLSKKEHSTSNSLIRDQTKKMEPKPRLVLPQVAQVMTKVAECIVTNLLVFCIS